MEIDEIQKQIKCALPNLAKDNVVKLSKYLQEIGLDSVKDFTCLDADDLKEYLTPFQVKKFQKYFSDGML